MAKVLNFCFGHIPKGSHTSLKSMLPVPVVILTSQRQRSQLPLQHIRASAPTWHPDKLQKHTNSFSWLTNISMNWCFRFEIGVQQCVLSLCLMQVQHTMLFVVIVVKCYPFPFLMWSCQCNLPHDHGTPLSFENICKRNLSVNVDQCVSVTTTWIR